MGSLTFSSCVLSLLVAKQRSKLPPYAIYRKTNKTTWKNDKKPNFRPDFGPFWAKFGPKKFFLWVLPQLDVTHCCKLSLYVISSKTNEPNVRK